MNDPVTCVNCGLVVEFDTDATDEEKPYPHHDGMWRALWSNSTVCDSESAYSIEAGYPSRTWAVHDPVQRFLVAYHTTSGSMGEAIYPQERWTVASRLEAIGLKNAIKSACVSVGHDEFVVQIIPLSVDVVDAGPTNDWADVVAKFHTDQHLDEYDEDNG